MELSSPKIKKFLILYSLSPQNVFLKKFLYFFLKKPPLKSFSCFLKKECFSYILGNRTFLYFGKRDFLTPGIKKFRR